MDNDILKRGGLTDKSLQRLMNEINSSLADDIRIWPEDITGSIAHVQMLKACDHLTESEQDKLVAGLKQVAKELGDGSFVPDPSLEDIHLNIEARLTEIVGPVAGKLHTARSRNDQVATDVRLYCRRKLIELDGQLKLLQAALIEKAELHTETVMPGLTHLQIAQPISFGFHLMAYCEAVGRDRERIADAMARVNFSPLGAAALAGSQHRIDRKKTAHELGFQGVLPNAMDAVASRDHLLEVLSTLSIAALTLSRLAEELVLWSSDFFGFITLAKELTSGSSIMPQKQNPDAAELIRAKSADPLAAFVKLATIVKALPFAYSKDLQEDKPTVIGALDEVQLMVRVMTAIIRSLTVNVDKMRDKLTPESLATDIADFLVEQGLPFRQAYQKVKSLFENDKLELSGDRLRLVDPALPEAISQLIDPDAALRRRDSSGGSAPRRVIEHIASAKKRFL